jgi:hypothetical protein
MRIWNCPKSQAMSQRIGSYDLLKASVRGRVRESLIKSEKQVHHGVRGKCRKSLVSTIFNNSRTRHSPTG